MKYTHIIFDMDGTLVNTSIYTIPACKQASQEMGMQVPTDDAVISAIGYSSEEFYRLILPSYGQETLGQYGRRVHEIEKRIIYSLGKAILFPGVQKMLNDLIDCGTSLYIASTGECEYVNLVLSSAGINDFFSSVSAGESEKKAMTIRIRKTSPDGTWAFVGDRFKDSDAAKAAGMISIFAGWGFTSSVEGALFNCIATSMNELLKTLGYASL